MCGCVFTLVNSGACVTYLERGVQRSTGVSVLIFQLVFDRVSCLWLCTPSETVLECLGILWLHPQSSGSTPILLAPSPFFWLHLQSLCRSAGIQGAPPQPALCFTEVLGIRFTQVLTLGRKALSPLSLLLRPGAFLQ